MEINLSKCIPTLLVIILSLFLLGCINQKTVTSDPKPIVYPGSDPFVMCLQETANISTACGGLATGSYACNGAFASAGTNCSQEYDGNYSSGGIVAAAGGPAIMYVNYTKPLYANSTSLWQAKWQRPSDTTTVFTNYTIPSDCWSQTPLQFRVQLSYSANTLLSCQNSTGWQTIANDSGLDATIFYEEAMWWNITSVPDTNVSIWNGTNWIFYNSTNLMNFRCANPPTLCEPQNQNASTNQSILLNQNNGSGDSTFQQIKVNATWGEFFCYQESANISNQAGNDGNCGQEYTGKYGYEINATGRFDTNGKNFLYVNYTKPFGATNNSQWQVEHGENSSSTFAPILPRPAYNITLPNDCWNAYSDKLRLRFVSYTGGDDSAGHLSSWPECYNGTIWNMIGNNYSTNQIAYLNNEVGLPAFWRDGNWSTFSSRIAFSNSWQDGEAGDNFSKSGDAEIFEEAMWWNIPPSGSLLCGTSTNSSLATSVLMSYSNYSNTTLATGQNQSIYCWMNATTVGPGFARKFRITINNTG